MKHRQGANNHYFGNLWEGIKTSISGLRLSIKHAWQARHRRKPMYVQDSQYFSQKDGIVTLQYPLESLPVPDHARYRLYNEMDDCIVCDKCAKICPVDCIDIEPIRASEQVGSASDGSPIRLYAAKFDIDMAKCCYCGLCTTVCPTECLTMTKAYDYSEENVRDMIYHFANLTPEEAEDKLALWNQYQAEKEALKAQKALETPTKPAASKPSGGFKPKFKPKQAPKPSQPTSEEAENPKDKATPRPSFKPNTPKPADQSPSDGFESPQEESATTNPSAKPRPKFKPKIAGKPSTESPAQDSPEKKPAPKPRPTFKPKIAGKPSADDASANTNEEVPRAKPRPKFRPKIKGNSKPKPGPDAGSSEEN